MSKKIKINIPGFKKIYVQKYNYRLYDIDEYYIIFKEGTYIKHNEYGPAVEWKYNGSYAYRINDQYHRLDGPAFYNKINKRIYKTNNEYFVIGKFLGYTQKKFIKKLANTLIPKE